MTNETEEDSNEEESSSKPSSFLTSLLNHSKSVSELNNVIPPSAPEGVSIKLEEWNNLDVVEVNCKFCNIFLVSTQGKTENSNFPMFLTFLSSLFRTFLMWFSFSTFPGTKLVKNAHFTLIFGCGKLAVGGTKKWLEKLRT